MTENWFRENAPDLEKLRKELHANPELSTQEFKTADSIVSFLEANTNAVVKRVGKTGVIALFGKGNTKGKTIMLRSDTDALPIQEVNSFTHKSKIEGVSHKCGHDGHTAIMLGVAKALTDYPIQEGRILLLWQPAEENGRGAVEMLQDPFFEDIHIDHVLALHNLPGYARNKIVLKKGSFTPQVKSLIIKLQGKTAHAAEPEHGHNPALALSDIIKYCDSITVNDPSVDDFYLITTIYMTLGSKSYGISAGEGELHLTIRSWLPEVFDSQSNQLIEFIKKEASDHNLSVDFSWMEEFNANINSEDSVNYLEQAAVRNSLEVEWKPEPFKWGEDFGLFTQRFKGAMFGIGAGVDTPALHNPDYDYPDEITPTAIKMFYTTLQTILT